ncbi:uncharacterized protein LOC141646278 [Silene latifolia]|uniref:uncharacterized protein LOC141646278 n=1 Tax=Silene latifolia TaxID=37657 RepID=UPI003D7733EA
MSMEKHDLWRKQQRSGAAMLEKHLKAKWTLEELIDNQLKRLQTHYNEAMVITRPEDVAQVLMPKWTPPLEMACMSWLGDWRPTAILELLQSFARTSHLSPSLADSADSNSIMSKLIRETRIEEAIIDEEMAEIQATCILCLPFSANQNNTSGFASVESELRKIKQVIIKGQQLRLKVLELIVKKVLSEVDAAEFLVVFAGIQDAVHQFAAQQSLHKGPVKVSLKKLGTV